MRRAVLLCLLMCVAPAAAAPAARAAGAWRLPVDVSAPAAETGDAQVAVDQAGRALVVWRHWEGEVSIVQAALRATDGTFGAPGDLSHDGRSAVTPAVAVNARGDAIVAWQRLDGANTTVQATVRPAGGGFSTPVDLSTPGQEAEEPQVAIDASGGTYVVWRAVHGTRGVAQASIGSVGASFSPPVDLSAADRTANAPQVAVNAAGEAVAVWATHGPDPALLGVQAATRPVGGAFSAPAVLASGVLAAEPQVAIAASGETLAVWTQPFAAPTPSIVTAVRPAGSAAWSSSTFADGDRPQVAMAPGGDAVAVWRGSDARDFSTPVIAAEHPPGGVFTSLGALATGDQAEAPRVAIDEHGAAVVVWQSWVGGLQVAAAVRDAGATFAAPTVLAGTQPLAFGPDVAMTAGGGAIAVFTRTGGSGGVVQAAEYDPTP
jgi:hypothetical protein